MNKLVCLLICLSLNLPMGCTFNRFIQQNDMALSRQQKDAIIERAIAYEFSEPKNNPIKEDERFQDAAKAKVSEANYEEAIAVTLSGLKGHRDSFSLQYFLAALIGDTSEITAEPLKSKMIKKSEDLFDKLMNSAEIQPKNIYFKFKNEYFFRLADYRAQFENGIAFVDHFSSDGKVDSPGMNGYYCQGVGAAHYAKSLVNQGKITLARQYAQKSIKAWAQYFSYDNEYYNSYVHYALALGILGHIDDMMVALTRSASLIHKDLGYHEFKEVIDFIQGKKNWLKGIEQTTLSRNQKHSLRFLALKMRAIHVAYGRNLKALFSQHLA